MTLNPKRALRAGLDAVVRKAARNYIVGPALDDAVRVGKALTARGYAVAFGYWDAGGDSAAHVLKTALAALDELAGLPGANYLSLKAPALGGATAPFRTLTNAARANAGALHFDSLDIAQTEPIFKAVSRCASSPDVEIGCTLPGRWRRSLDDAERAIDLGLAVRVVKGQSPDPEEPDRDAAAGYLEVIEKLAGRARKVRVASHNAEITKRAFALLKSVNTPCELELLYGLPVGEQVEIAQSFLAPVRVYLAYGHGFLPYAVGSLRRNPAGVLRLAREALRGDCLATFPDLRE